MKAPIRPARSRQTTAGRSFLILPTVVAVTMIMALVLVLVLHSGAGGTRSSSTTDNGGSGQASQTTATLSAGTDMQGRQAPAFTLSDQYGNPIALTSLAWPPSCARVPGRDLHGAMSHFGPIRELDDAVLDTAASISDRLGSHQREPQQYASTGHGVPVEEQSSDTCSLSVGYAGAAPAALEGVLHPGAARTDRRRPYLRTVPHRSTRQRT